MKVKVLYHNHCFDGACSAAVFSTFHRAVVDSKAEFVYHGLTHKPGKMFEDDVFDAEEHAIVDFKYSSHENVTWWFDHHQSAFLSSDDEAHFRADASGKKFYDPNYKSCTKFIADIAREKFGCDLSRLSELVEWADLIDGAQYETAEQAVSLDYPATKLALVIESTRDQALLHHVIRLLQTETLEGAADDARVREVFTPMLERHSRAVEIIRANAHCADGVVHFDVSGHDLDGYNKFIAYWLFPRARYSVGVSRGAMRSKVSLGWNPWSGQARTHNLASICERYGGGGHAVVGAISYAPEELDRARETAREIVHELRTT